MQYYLRVYREEGWFLSEWRRFYKKVGYWSDLNKQIKRKRGYEIDLFDKKRKIFWNLGITNAKIGKNRKTW